MIYRSSIKYAPTGPNFHYFLISVYYISSWWVLIKYYRACKLKIAIVLHSEKCLPDLKGYHHNHPRHHSLLYCELFFSNLILHRRISILWQPHFLPNATPHCYLHSSGKWSGYTLSPYQSVRVTMQVYGNILLWREKASICKLKQWFSSCVMYIRWSKSIISTDWISEL